MSNPELDELIAKADDMIREVMRKKASQDTNLSIYDFSPNDCTDENSTQEKLNRSRLQPLVQLTLYPEGFSLKILDGRNGDCKDDLCLPYEDTYNLETGLLEYIDAGLMPPTLFDILMVKFPDRINQVDICYGQEVDIILKDLRHVSSSLAQVPVSQVKLKGSSVTMMRVVKHKLISANHEKRRMKNMNIKIEPANGEIEESKAKKRRKKPIKAGSKITPEEIESQVIDDCSEPLCLEPSPVMHLIENKLSHAAQTNKPSIKIFDETKNPSQRNKHKQDPDFAPLTKMEGLANFLASKEQSLKIPATDRAMKHLQDLHGCRYEYPINIEETKKLDIEKVTEEITKVANKKVLALSSMNRNFNDNSLVKVEEYLMEFDLIQNQSPTSHGMTAVSIFQRPIDDTFFGQLFVDRAGLQSTDLRSSSSSRSCLFRLGSRENAKAYLEQFTEILSENGRKSVRIHRSGPGAGIPQTTTVQNQHHQQRPSVTIQQPSLVHNLPQQQVSITAPPKVQLQGSNVQVIHPSSIGTKVILPAPVQQIQPLGHAPQMIPTPIAPAPSVNVQQQLKNQKSNAMSGMSLCSLLQAPMQVQVQNTNSQNQSAASLHPKIEVQSNQQLGQLTQQQILQTGNATQSWIVLPPHNNLQNATTVMMPPSNTPTNAGVSTVPVTQVGQGFRPLHVILWPHQQQASTVSVQPIVHSQSSSGNQIAIGNVNVTPLQPPLSPNKGSK